MAQAVYQGGVMANAMGDVARILANMPNSWDKAMDGFNKGFEMTSKMVNDAMDQQNKRKELKAVLDQYEKAKKNKKALEDEIPKSGTGIGNKKPAAVKPFEAKPVTPEKETPAKVYSSAESRRTYGKETEAGKADYSPFEWGDDGVSAMDDYMSTENLTYDEWQGNSEDYIGDVPSDSGGDYGGDYGGDTAPTDMVA